MSLLTTNLVVAGTLFLSPNHPALVHKPGPTVWFSGAKAIEAQSGAREIILKSKGPGLTHATGLDAGSQAPLRIQSVSDATYAALSKCPAAALDWSVSPPAPHDTEDKTLEKLNTCGFDALGIPEAEVDRWTKNFQSAEARLLQAGLRLRGPARTARQREIKIAGDETWVLSRAKKVLGPWRPFYAIQVIDGPKPGRTLVFEVDLFEFSRAKAASVGVRWPQSFHLKALDGNNFTLSAGALGSNDPGVDIGADFGESLGVGRVLARPQIRTKPGEKATFQSGGEIPIRTSTPYATSTQWKNYGLLLTLEPDAQIETGATEITLGFKLELSEPDPATAIDGVPGMKTRRLDSRFDLRTDELTILTTLIQTRSGTTNSGVPGLRQIPIFESLFNHKDTAEQDSELWFAIRPTWEEIRND